MATLSPGMCGPIFAFLIGNSEQDLRRTLAFHPDIRQMHNYPVPADRQLQFLHGRTMKYMHQSRLEDGFIHAGCTYFVETYSPDEWRNERGQERASTDLSA